jgi:hypothetical protein
MKTNGLKINLRAQPNMPVAKKNNKMLLVGVLVIIVIVAAVAAVVLMGGNIGSSNNSQGNQVQIKVTYTGDWKGSYTDLSQTVSWDGTGDKTVTLTRPSGNAGLTWIVSANAQKYDGDPTGTLTISILKMDGTVIKTASTSADYGLAQVSTTIG